MWGLGSERPNRSKDRVIALYTENREFGLYLVSLIARRLIANNEELERRLA